MALTGVTFGSFGRLLLRIILFNLDWRVCRINGMADAAVP
jgi:hypothetical protein